MKTDSLKLRMTQMARIIEYKDALIRIFRILRMTRIKTIQTEK